MRNDDDAEVKISRDGEVVRFRCPDCRGCGRRDGATPCNGCGGLGYRDVTPEEYERLRRPPPLVVILTLLLIEAAIVLAVGALLWVGWHAYRTWAQDAP
jgi:hypothetical protein